MTDEQRTADAVEPVQGLSGAQMQEMMEEVEEMRRENRIEALRAASRIVAASGVPGGYGEYTIQLADKFAHWLESGNRAASHETCQPGKIQL